MTRLAPLAAGLLLATACSFGTGPAVSQSVNVTPDALTLVLSSTGGSDTLAQSWQNTGQQARLVVRLDGTATGDVWARLYDAEGTFVIDARTTTPGTEDVQVSIPGTPGMWELEIDVVELNGGAEVQLVRFDP